MIRKESDASNHDEPEQRARPTLRTRIVSWLKVACFTYVIGLVVWLVAVKWIGERSFLTSIALFAPPQVWLLPILLLFPLTLLFQRKLLWLLLLGVLFVYFGYMNFHVSATREPSGNTLSILSNNIGQRKTRTMWPFLRSENPDIFALQEARNHRQAISSENPEHYVANHGEYLLASRFEIVNSGIVPNLRSRTGPIAAWFEIDFHGTPVVIYNVHMPTPRNDLNRLRGKGLLFEIARLAGINVAEGRTTYTQSLQARNQLAIDFLQHLRAEKRPFIVVGDFNMPDTGYLHRLYTSELTDAFAAKGTGYGCTFPGFSWNPLTLFGPWLRIDYIFAGKAWQPLSCKVEPRQSAQHLSVAAEFEFSQSN